MTSPAAEKYQTLQVRADFLQKIAIDKRIKPLTRDEAENYLHAALAAYVAAWEAYVENLVKDFYSITAEPLNLSYSAIHTIARNRAEILLEKFNTPNAENTREFLVKNTGYDPWPDWRWPARNLNNIMTRERLNEILKIRHSFSHGFSIPQYQWNSLPSGRCRLTATSLRMVQSFFANLVRKTDTGMKLHIRSIYKIKPTW